MLVVKIYNGWRWPAVTLTNKQIYQKFSATEGNFKMSLILWLFSDTFSALQLCWKVSYRPTSRQLLSFVFRDWQKPTKNFGLDLKVKIQLDPRETGVKLWTGLKCLGLNPLVNVNMRLNIWVVWKKGISFSSLRKTLKGPIPSVIWCEFLRQEILERRNARRQRRQDMAKRRTAAAQERMRLISQLARKEKRDDNFGMRDEDWDVYKAINKVLITRCTCRTGEM